MEEMEEKKVSDEKTISANYQNISGMYDLSSLSAKSIDDYIIQNELGRGGMGIVYKAIDKNLQRRVAIKFLYPYLLKDEGFLKRFAREARISSSLDHPNITRVYASKIDKDMAYIVMQLVEGIPLNELLKKRVFIPVRKKLEIALKTAMALKYAHRKGVIHRDIKPANILITKDWDVRVMDFGLAKSTYEVSLTQSQCYMGTPQYSSPEQARSERVTYKSDIYSLGVVIYELFTGSLPYSSTTTVACLREIASPDSSKITLDNVNSHTLKLLIRRMLDKDPMKRPELNEVIQVLKKLIVMEKREFAGRSSITAYPNVKIYLFLGVTILLFFLFLFFKGLIKKESKESSYFQMASYQKQEKLCALPFITRLQPLSEKKQIIDEQLKSIFLEPLVLPDLLYLGLIYAKVPAIPFQEVLSEYKREVSKYTNLTPTDRKEMFFNVLKKENLNIRAVITGIIKENNQKGKLEVKIYLLKPDERRPVFRKIADSNLSIPIPEKIQKTIPQLYGSIIYRIYNMIGEPVSYSLDKRKHFLQDTMKDYLKGLSIQINKIVSLFPRRAEQLPIMVFINDSKKIEEVITLAQKHPITFLYDDKQSRKSSQEETDFSILPEQAKLHLLFRCIAFNWDAFDVITKGAEKKYRFSEIVALSERDAKNNIISLKLNEELPFKERMEEKRKKYNFLKRWCVELTNANDDMNIILEGITNF